MSTLKDRFEQAVADSRQLPERPDNRTLLQLYALYKQATEGDAVGERPAMTDFVARAKWDAWHEQAGAASDTAMTQYIDLVESLK